MSRVTLHRTERGEPSVTMGAYVNAMSALGLGVEVSPLSPQEALDLYEHGWRHVAPEQIEAHERRLIAALVQAHGNGHLLV